MTEDELRGRGVPARVIAERCRPEGPWQELLPRVYLLQPGPATGEQRVRAALLYAGRATPRQAAPRSHPAVVTGLAALALYGFPGVPGAEALDAVDVLVPRQRRLPDAGHVRIRRARVLPEPVWVNGLSCAPLLRALVDAVTVADDPRLVRALLVDAVRLGACDGAELVAAVRGTPLQQRADVVEAVGVALAGSRAEAEGFAYRLVRECGLPDPVWNVSLHRPDGAFLAAVDAYWPEQGVVLDVDVRPLGFDEEDWAEEAGRREQLERIGLTVLYVTPEKLRDAPTTQATVVDAALREAWRLPAAARMVVALPR